MEAIASLHAKRAKIGFVSLLDCTDRHAPGEREQNGRLCVWWLRNLISSKLKMAFGNYFLPAKSRRALWTNRMSRGLIVSAFPLWASPMLSSLSGIWAERR